MNVRRLLAEYDTTFDASDAIPRLRRFILELAVRGKLADQDPTTDPASELLEQIAVEKTRLLRTKTIKPRRPSGIVTRPALPFDLPIGWSPATVGQVLLQIQTGPFGSSLHQSDYQLGGVPVVNPASIQNEQIVPVAKMAVGTTTLARLSSFKLHTDDIVMARRGEMGRCAVVTDRESGWLCGTGSLILRPSKFIYPRFLSMVIGSPFSRQYLGGTAVGTTMQNLNQTILLNLPFGLPPLAEQRRIVVKVDELMAVCERLATARAERETIRNRLAAATLARVNEPNTDPATFRNHAIFALENLTPLTTRPDHIGALRQTILNLAARGRLVEQDPNDRLAIDFDGPIPSNVAPPFDIPKNWTWARLCKLGRVVGGATPPKTRDDYWNGEIPWVSPKDMKIDYITEAQMSISEAAIAGSSAKVVPETSVLFVVRGMILAHSFPVAVTRVPVAINQDMKAIVLQNRDMADYVLCMLKGTKLEMLSRVRRSTHGTCRIERSDYKDFLIPVAPLPEQHRIVAKVNELMMLCDRLEENLATGTSIRSRLLGADLCEVLNC